MIEQPIGDDAADTSHWRLLTPQESQGTLDEVSCFLAKQLGYGEALLARALPSAFEIATAEVARQVRPEPELPAVAAILVAREVLRVFAGAVRHLEIDARLGITKMPGIEVASMELQEEVYAAVFQQLSPDHPGNAHGGWFEVRHWMVTPVLRGHADPDLLLTYFVGRMDAQELDVPANKCAEAVVQLRQRS